MSARGWIGALVLLLGSVEARAQRPPETHPTSSHQRIELKFDRSAPPGDVVLWPERTVLGMQAVDGSGPSYGQINLTCRSSVDATSGRCSAEVLEDRVIGPAPITLEFREQRSGQRIEVDLTAGIQRIEGSQRCNADYWDPQIFVPWTTGGTNCFVPPIGTGVQLQLVTNQVARLVAGRWTATLILGLRVDASGGIASSHTFDFDLTITDRDNVAIYFPSFDQITPLVGLNLAYDPISAPPSIGGRAHLDMCLYDGLGSQSEYLAVTVREKDPRPAPGRVPGRYSVWHHGGGREPRDRLDFQIRLDHDGQVVPLPNAEEVRLHGIDRVRLRLVMLPGMSQPVFCVPTPLTLDTPRVPASEKRDGYYDGELQVQLRLPTDLP